MKRCPTCNVDYFDEMLEFCLEDGARLIFVSNPESEKQTVTNSSKQNPTNADTVSKPFSNIPDTTQVAIPQTNNAQPVFFRENKDLLPESEKGASTGSKVLEVAPIVVSLAHNWWQWVYLNNQFYSSFTSYVFSANFLMWLLLFIVSVALGLLSLRFCQKRAFAYTSLVIVAVNLILFLVPKR